MCPGELSGGLDSGWWEEDTSSSATLLIIGRCSKGSTRICGGEAKQRLFVVDSRANLKSRVPLPKLCPKVASPSPVTLTKT